jgi:hypothetical protein
VLRCAVSMSCWLMRRPTLASTSTDVTEPCSTVRLAYCSEARSFSATAAHTSGEVHAPRILFALFTRGASVHCARYAGHPQAMTEHGGWMRAAAVQQPAGNQQCVLIAEGSEHCTSSTCTCCRIAQQSAPTPATVVPRCGVATNPGLPQLSL